jgi:hypothetical protein
LRLLRQSGRQYALCGDQRADHRRRPVMQRRMNGRSAPPASAALTQELHDIVENDRYPFSPRVQTPRAILAKLRPEPVREPLRARGRRRRGCEAFLCFSSAVSNFRVGHFDPDKLGATVRAKLISPPCIISNG